MIDFGLVLSTGRTGTMFFRDYITDTFDKAICLHEPRPSRRYKVYSNLLLKNRIPQSIVAKGYFKSRSVYLSGELNNKIYVESNNFLFGCIPALNSQYSEIKILHLIRNPFDYIQSHLNHGFWRGRKKYGAKYLPYWLEDLELTRSEKNNPYVILTKRWIYVNEVIARYSDTNPYLLIKFEDLFSTDFGVSSHSLSLIRIFFEQGPVTSSFDMSIKKNPSKILESIPEEQYQIILKNLRHSAFVQYY